MTDKPADAELWAEINRYADAVAGLQAGCIGEDVMNPVRDALSAVLAKWGQPAQAAEPVAWAHASMGDWGYKISEKVLKITRHAQPQHGFVTPLYLAPQPVALEPLSAAQKQHIHNETGAGHALICLVESYLLEAHGIKGGQHGTDSHP